MFIDIIAIILAVFGFYSGYKRGIIDALFDLFSIFIAIVAAGSLAPIAIRFIESVSGWSPLANTVVGFVLTFFVVVMLIRLIGNQFEKLMKTLQINFLNKFAGGLLSASLMVAIFSGALWLTNQAQLLPDNIKSESTLYPVLELIPDIFAGLFKALKPLFIDFWEILQSAIETVKEKGETLG